METNYIKKLWILFALLVGGFQTVSGAELNLYEWTAVAEDVVVGRVLAQEGKHVLVKAERILRGSMEAGSEFLVRQKAANRSRNSSQNALRLKHGLRYMLLLDPAGYASKKPDALPTYDLARGVAGAREMPKEGEPAIIEALEQFIEIQALNSDIAQWRSFKKLVEDGRNDIITRTALEMFLKFRRGEADLMLSVEPLMDHPRPAIRSLSARLLGQLIERHGGDSSYLEQLRATMMAHARRDRSIDVRVAATSSLASFSDDETIIVLREIAAEDPEQAVRYAAEKVLFEKRDTQPNQ